MARRVLILASESRYRRELLERLGIAFECKAPLVDEDSLRDPSRAPADQALHLACAKAHSIASTRPDATVIGSDQVCACDGEVFGKPGTPALTLAQLERLAGRTHELCTAVCVVQGIREWTFVDRTRLTMRALSRVEIEHYVDQDRPFDCAGAYKIEAHGVALFTAIASEDHNAIVGLPLLGLAEILREFGVSP